MRLIDADEALNLIDGETKVETNSNVKAFNDALEVAIQIIDTQKTVEAIPIEWIEKKALEFLMNRNFRWATDFQEVVDLWKVENNIPLFDDELKITLEEENEVNRR